MNTLVSIVGCHICQVRYVPRIVGKPLPGEVVCGGDVAYFGFESSRNVVINDDNEPCFGTGKASFLKPGDEIVALVEEVRRGHYIVTAWTHIRDWNGALESLKQVQMPKPAPAIPPLSVTTVLPERQNQTGRDRRPVFKTARQQQQIPPVVNFEEQLLAAAAEMPVQTAG